MLKPLLLSLGYESRDIILKPSITHAIIGGNGGRGRRERYLWDLLLGAIDRLTVIGWLQFTYQNILKQPGFLYILCSYISHRALIPVEFSHLFAITNPLLR